MACSVPGNGCHLCAKGLCGYTYDAAQIYADMDDFATAVFSTGFYSPKMAKCKKHFADCLGFNRHSTFVYVGLLAAHQIFGTNQSGVCAG